MIGDEGEQLLKEYVKSMSGIKDDDDKIIGFDPGEALVKAAHLERLLFPPNSEDITDAMAFAISRPYSKELTLAARLEAAENRLAEKEATIRRLDKSAAELLEKAEKVIKNQQTQIDFLKSTAADLFECLMENGYERI